MVGDEDDSATQRARQRCPMTATRQLDVRSESCERDTVRCGSNSPTNLALLLHPASRGVGQREAGRGQQRVQPRTDQKEGTVALGKGLNSKTHKGGHTDRLHTVTQVVQNTRVSC